VRTDFSHCVCAFMHVSVCLCVTAPSQVTPSPSSAAQRRAQRRLTRVDNRYHSGQLITRYSVLCCLLSYNLSPMITLVLAVLLNN